MAAARASAEAAVAAAVTATHPAYGADEAAAFKAAVRSLVDTWCEAKAEDPGANAAYLEKKIRSLVCPPPPPRPPLFSPPLSLLPLRGLPLPPLFVILPLLLFLLH